jgi:ribonuclease G
MRGQKEQSYMPKEIYISSTPHETRLAIVESDALTEIYYERENEYTLAGSIYNGRVTRVLPGMQSAFVDIGLERDAFLYITDFMEEAGESAEFEGDGAQREGGQRGGQRGGGQKQSSREPVTLEGGQVAERTRDRNDRNRGRRDRNNNSRQPEGENTVSEPTEVAPDEELAAEGFVEGQQVGEGAPGADGSRRWRGRRGRRRGRGQRDDSRQQATTQPQEPEAAEVNDSEQVESYEAPFEFDGAADQEFSAEAASTDPNEIPLDDSNRGSRRPSASAQGSEDRGSEGGRGRRDRGGRGGRGGPRGFEPRTSSYGIEDGAAAGPYGAAPTEPIILPGESLSKYRPGGAEPEASASSTAKAAPIVTAVTAPGYQIPEGWDGGFVLPGESLSRRRDRPAPAHAAKPVPVVKAPAAVVEVTPEVEAAQVEEAEVRSETATVPEAIVAPVEPVEYEPTEDTAISFRVDPVAPSEFRQSAPVEEAASAVIEEVEEEQVEEVVASHTELPHAEIEQAESVSEPVPSEPVAETVEVASDMTSIHASGLMESVAPVIAPEEVESEHEALESASSFVEEEEAIDDNDYDTMLHASSVEELDDLDEEEMLEGAADLGTMLRDMSIDDITSADPDEEEDFEEEDAIDDGTSEGYAEEAYAADDTEVADSEEGAEFAEESEPVVADGAAPTDRQRDPDRRRGRRDNRRGGRDRDRGRNAGGGGDRERGRGRMSMQATDLPAISELLKPGQEILVQIAKEPIAKKGARITSHIALPGRFLVFMPTVNHTGVSRKIESDGERRRLKEILLSEKGEAAGGFIVRTAASGASEEELRSDLRFLLNLWADIKQRSEGSKSPALIYHDLNLVERILRDQVTDNFSAIWVDSEENYERILRFLQRFQPSLIRRVKLYTKETPLFEQFGLTEEINKALRSKVWLKSGGSIVINQTEALVAIDINTGKYVGKTARLEDTIVKTNLDAIPEIVRQIRLRDLGGIIIIDFIDMDERKNRNRVMAALEEELKSDRAPSKILQFNDFGLVAITRKRVKQSLERTLSTPCNVCVGTGMVKSPVTVCNDIYIEMRKMVKHLDRGDVMLRVHPDVVKQLKSSTKWLQEMEEIVGKTILVKSDPSLHPEQFDIH